MKGSFPSFFILYQLLYKSRIILEDTDYSTYSGYLPDWLYYWSALSTKPPLPGFYSLPAGRTKKTWGRNHDVNNSVVWEEGSRRGGGGERVECIIYIITHKGLQGRHRTIQLNSSQSFAISQSNVRQPCCLLLCTFKLIDSPF